MFLDLCRVESAARSITLIRVKLPSKHVQQLHKKSKMHSLEQFLCMMYNSEKILSTSIASTIKLDFKDDEVTYTIQKELIKSC